MSELEDALLVLHHDGSDRASGYHDLLERSGLDYMVKPAGELGLHLDSDGCRYRPIESDQSDGILLYLAVQSNHPLPELNVIFADLQAQKQKISEGRQQAKVEGYVKPKRQHRPLKPIPPPKPEPAVVARTDAALSDDEKWWLGIKRL